MRNPAMSITLLYVFMATLLGVLAYFILTGYSQECFDNIATEYCEKNFDGFSRHNGQNRFYCTTSFSRGTGTNKIKLYFTQEEIKSCIIKEPFTFKRLDK